MGYADVRYAHPNWAVAGPFLVLIIIASHLLYFHGEDFDVNGETEFGRRNHNGLSAVYYHGVLRLLHAVLSTVLPFTWWWWIVTIIHVAHVGEACYVTLLCVKNGVAFGRSLLFVAVTALLGVMQVQPLKWEIRRAAIYKTD